MISAIARPTALAARCHMVEQIRAGEEGPAQLLAGKGRLGFGASRGDLPSLPVPIRDADLHGPTKEN